MFSWLLTIYFIRVSLCNLLCFPKIGIVSYVMSICKVPYTFSPQDLDKSIQYLGGISATKISMNTLFDGTLARVTHKSLIKPKHLTLHESKDKKYLYGLVISNTSFSIITLGMRLCEVPESNMAL